MIRFRKKKNHSGFKLNYISEVVGRSNLLSNRYNQFLNLLGAILIFSRREISHRVEIHFIYTLYDYYLWRGRKRYRITSGYTYIRYGSIQGRLLYRKILCRKLAEIFFQELNFFLSIYFEMNRMYWH